MKRSGYSVMGILSFLVLSVTAPKLGHAGACDTNANSLERAFNQHCASRQGADCHTCVQQQYDTLTRVVPDSCKAPPNGAVLLRRQQWEAAHCQ